MYFAVKFPIYSTLEFLENPKQNLCHNWMHNNPLYMPESVCESPIGVTYISVHIIRSILRLSQNSNPIYLRELGKDALNYPPHFTKNKWKTFDSASKTSTCVMGAQSYANSFRISTS